MNKLFLLAIPLLIFSLAFPPSAYAIILLAPIVLIPVVKILAIVFAGLSLPLTTISLVISKLFKKNPKKLIIISVLILLIIMLATVIILKAQNPDRPFF